MRPAKRPTASADRSPTRGTANTAVSGRPKRLRAQPQVVKNIRSDTPMTLTSCLFHRKQMARNCTSVRPRACWACSAIQRVGPARVEIGSTTAAAVSIATRMPGEPIGRLRSVPANRAAARMKQLVPIMLPGKPPAIGRRGPSRRGLCVSVWKGPAGQASGRPNTRPGNLPLRRAPVANRRIRGAQNVHLART